MRRRKGFTLLETVVAMALFASAGMVLYALFNSNLIALNRAQDVTRQAPVVRQAMERLSAVNPWWHNEGRFEIDGFAVAWTASLVAPVRQGQSKFGELADFDIGLYDVEFQIRDQSRLLGTWRMRVVGYEKARGLISEEMLF